MLAARKDLILLIINYNDNLPNTMASGVVNLTTAKLVVNFGKIILKIVKIRDLKNKTGNQVKLLYDLFLLVQSLEKET